MALQFLRFLGHGLEVALRVLLVQLALSQFRVDADLLHLIVERIVAEDAERLICLRHLSSLLQTDEIELVICAESFRR